MPPYLMRFSFPFFLLLATSATAFGQAKVDFAEEQQAVSLREAFRRPVNMLLAQNDGFDRQRSQLERRFLLHLATDQVEFVRGTGRFRLKDLRWALPLAGATGLTLATDPEASRKLAGSNAGRWKTSSNISDGGLLAMGTLAGGTYLWGAATHDPHKRETGVLAIEAATGALIDNEAIKQIFSRDRPTVGSGE